MFTLLDKNAQSNNLNYRWIYNENSPHWNTKHNNSHNSPLKYQQNKQIIWFVQWV